MIVFMLSMAMQTSYLYVFCTMIGNKYIDLKHDNAELFFMRRITPTVKPSIRCK